MTHVALSPHLEASTGLHGVEGFLADTRIASRTPARVGNILKIKRGGGGGVRPGGPYTCNPDSKNTEPDTHSAVMFKDLDRDADFFLNGHLDPVRIY
jgi:hypothetical protein